MPRGYAYLVVVMDWKTRAVLAWKLSNTLDGGFCVEAFLEACGARVSMDGKGRWMDNVFVERLWRALKHEGVYMWAYDDMHQVERALGQWLADYNLLKPHMALD